MITSISIRQRIFLFLCLTAITVSTDSRAAVTVVWSDIGSDVVAEYSGSLDLSGYNLTDFYANTTRVWLGNSLALFFANVPDSRMTHYWRSSGGGPLLKDLVALDHRGVFDGTMEPFGFANDGTGNLYVSPGYVSGTLITGEARFLNTNVASIFGSDTFNNIVYDDGVNAVTFVAIPEPSSLGMLLGSAAAILLIRSRAPQA